MAIGKLAIITGANSGLGFETARLLAEKPDTTVILACRDLAKAEDARAAIVQKTGNDRVRTIQLDVSSLSSVRQFAAQITEHVDVLVCNAGIARGSTPTVDGFDRVFATNHLGHFLLTLSLIGRLSPNGRVISVSSDMHSPPGPKLRWPGAQALADAPSRVPVRLRYSFSKLCNLYFVYELARLLRDRNPGVSVAAFNPGLMTETNFATMPRAVGAILKRVVASRAGSLSTSSAALADLATRPNGDSIDGLYFDRTAAMPTRSSVLSYGIADARDLWQLSARLCEIDL